ncbi:MAG: hypothetical protein KY469_15345 [Actinobacteria bacterium]|nr:hypothetical protein [Actinomycetota bacterium]
MAGERVELPPEIRLSLDEVAVVMAALDIAEVHVPATSDDFRPVRAAIALLVEKLWPELGELDQE